ncbi:MAG: hypothetical protein RIQ93_1468 [Verrucomicrobiota bacterium]
MALAVTAFLLLFVNDGGPQDAAAAATPSQLAANDAKAPSLAEATQEAVASLRAVWSGFRRTLPKLGIAVVALLLGWLGAKVARRVAFRLTRGWARSQAISALVGIFVWLLSIGLAVSVLVGDLRALVGSLGLIGLALSWALQTPIESFTGWLLIRFKVIIGWAIVSPWARFSGMWWTSIFSPPPCGKLVRRTGLYSCTRSNRRAAC